MAADNFEGSVGFHRNERCSLAYDKRILEKSPLGQFCKSAFSRGVACHSRAMKKKTSSIVVRTAKFSRFYLHRELCVGSPR